MPQRRDALCSRAISRVVQRDMDSHAACPRGNGFGSPRANETIDSTEPPDWRWHGVDGHLGPFDGAFDVGVESVLVCGVGVHAPKARGCRSQALYSTPDGARTRKAPCAAGVFGRFRWRHRRQCRAAAQGCLVLPSNFAGGSARHGQPRGLSAWEWIRVPVQMNPSIQPPPSCRRCLYGLIGGW